MASPVRLLITRALPEAVLKPLRARSDVLLSMWPSEQEAMPKSKILEEVSKDSGCDGILCLLSDSVDAEVIRESKKLKTISTLSVGYSHIDVPTAVGNRIRIGYTPGVLTDATADLAVTLLLATARLVPEAAAAVKSGAWQTWRPFWLTGKAVGGKKVGIVG
jgi:lactate dehydrogenase-like 2-hydroxyacid dehydrogenase